MVEGFFEDGLPGFYVSSYIIECCAVDLQVAWWGWRSVEDGVEGYVSAYAM